MQNLEPEYRVYGKIFAIHRNPRGTETGGGYSITFLYQHVNRQLWQGTDTPLSLAFFVRDLLRVLRSRYLIRYFVPLYLNKVVLILLDLFQRGFLIKRQGVHPASF
ncbi:hypothetical protein P691DRAFT_812256 [Macrolepiota fuliginosa MF-IS2]|uniref:Uncharacterized protein n=1 Tax=Macrolepiota fuliginosa MF-IS2 TaxID=1400762 RepID=A0A9P5WZX9_9AGAR|nr:hypothetical protein P691DRAFT_812256 [Macrolepiota fuliginosa MF-IS2]